MSVLRAMVTSVMCSSVSVAVSPSPILQSDSSKIWAGNGRKGVTVFLYSLNIVCFTSVTKPQDGPGCGGDVGFLLTAFSKGEWKKLLLSENKRENLSKLRANLSHVKLDLTVCWWRTSMYIQYCLKEQTVLSGHPIQTEVFFLNSCFPMIYFSQWFFFMLTFSLYLCLCISAASWNPASCLFACLLATSKMLEWGLGWLLCWWQMKEKQTQLACLQLQWFSRAGSSEDMLFVDKTHDSKVWGEAEVDGISVWSSACHACMKSQLIVLT